MPKPAALSSSRRALRALSPACLITMLASASSSAQAQQPARWGIGAATVMSVNPYAGRGARIIPFPAITYESDSFYFFGIRGGAHLYDDQGFSLDAFAPLVSTASTPMNSGVPNSPKTASIETISPIARTASIWACRRASRVPTDASRSKLRAMSAAPAKAWKWKSATPIRFGSLRA